MISFADLVDVRVLSRAVGVPPQRIEDYAAHPDQASYYKILKIPKRGRRRRHLYRVVYATGHRNEWLSQLHKMIGVLVNRNTKFPDCVQGFVIGRSIRTNAAAHLGARIVLHGDLVDFFDAITTEHVQRAFIALGAPPDMASLLARASTIDGRLRQGTRCSPALANAVCANLDVELVALANSHAARYTRYGDNLTFSGDRVPASASVEQIVRGHGFELRDGACYEQLRGRPQFVTGLSVADRNQPRLPRELKRRLRLVMHYIAKHGVDEHLAHNTRRDTELRRGTHDQRAIEGMLRFVHAIEPALAAALRKQFRAGLAISYVTRELLANPPDPYGD